MVVNFQNFLQIFDSVQTFNLENIWLNEILKVETNLLSGAGPFEESIPNILASGVYKKKLCSS